MKTFEVKIAVEDLDLQRISEVVADIERIAEQIEMRLSKIKQQIDRIAEELRREINERELAIRVKYLDKEYSCYIDEMGFHIKELPEWYVMTAEEKITYITIFKAYLLALTDYIEELEKKVNSIIWE